MEKRFELPLRQTDDSAELTGVQTDDFLNGTVSLSAAVRHHCGALIIASESDKNFARSAHIGSMLRLFLCRLITIRIESLDGHRLGHWHPRRLRIVKMTLLRMGVARIALDVVRLAVLTENQFNAARLFVRAQRQKARTHTLFACTPLISCYCAE